MRITKFTHSCVRLETEAGRLVVDPGVFSGSDELEQALDGVDALLVTHEHPDHVDPEHVARLLTDRPGLRVWGPASVRALLPAHADRVTEVRAGESFIAGGLPVTTYGGQHALIHPSIPVVPNLAYLVGEPRAAVLHPGDAFVLPRCRSTRSWSRCTRRGPRWPRCSTTWPPYAPLPCTRCTTGCSTTAAAPWWTGTWSGWPRRTAAATSPSQWARPHRSEPAVRSVGRPGSTRLVPMVIRSYGFVVVLALGLATAAVAIAQVYDLPIRDPDGAIGPAYVWVPAVIVLAFLLDVVPRTVARAWSAGGLRRSLTAVVGERWPLRQVQLVLVGLGSWYLTYAAFRNLKSFVPFVRDGVDDGAVASVDRILAFGRNPADILHEMLGTGMTAHVLSFAYLAWIVFVPVSLVVAIVWSREAALGAWYVTAIGVDWVLGVASYYVLPTLGPVYTEPGRFSDLPATGTSRLQQLMIDERAAVVADPAATTAVQTIAAFASLHVAILVTACLVAHVARIRASVRWVLWMFLAVTVVATVYLGWHYLVDAIGGVAIGAAAAWLGAVATGNGHRLRPSRLPVAATTPRARVEA